HRQDTRALDMSQEFVAQALPLMGTFDQSRQVRREKLPLCIEPHQPQMRLQRGERVVADLGACATDAGEQRRLAGLGQPDQAHVRDELQLEVEYASLAWLSRLGVSRRLSLGAGEARVAPSASSSASNHEARLGVD